MDFRSNAQQNNRPATTPGTAAPTGQKQTGTAKQTKWFKILNLVMLFSVAILVLAVAFVFTRGSGTTNEKKFVDTSKYQAVFLNNGQVYFGHIGSLNDQYVQLTDIYYLTQSSTTATGSAATAANSNYTLIQLGCQQIHYPYGQMLINRDQVTFWENLNDKGQVVTKIKELKKQGVDCSQVSSQTQASGTSTSQQNASSTTGTATGTSSTDK